MKDILCNLPELIDSVYLKVANITTYGDKQVELRETCTNHLIWRAWDFEPNFYFDLERHIKPYIKNAYPHFDTITNPVVK